MTDSIDYLDIVKRAARATWQHKALWLFGFLIALGGGGGSNYSSNVNRMGSSNTSSSVDRLGNVDWQVYLPIIIVVGIVLFVMSIAIWVLRLVAEGAIIGMARDISRGGAPGVGDGFKVGGHYWLRMLGIEAVLILPIALVIIVLLVVGIMLAMGAAGVAGLSGSTGESASAALAGVGGICGAFALIGVGIVLLIPVIIVVTVVLSLARRYAVLRDMRVMESIRTAWGTLRGRFKDVALMWLVMVVVGMVVGIVVGLAGLVLLLPGLGAMFVNPAMGVALFIPGVLILAFVSGIIQAFTSVAWTDFFMVLEPAAA